MTFDDWTKVATGFAVFVAWMLEHVNNRRGRRDIRTQLAQCEKRSEKKDGEIGKLRDRLSALETEMVALRNLLPGGKWYRTAEVEIRPRKDRPSP